MFSFFRSATIVAGFSILGFTAAHATPVTVGTGTLGTVINDGGDYSTQLNATGAALPLGATLTISEGLYNSPEVNVAVLFNGFQVGSFTANSGYFSPGPELLSFDVSSYLVAGTNTILLDGTPTSGDWVIGSVSLAYDDGIGAELPPPPPLGAVPEPASLALLGVGLLGMAIAGRRKAQS